MRSLQAIGESLDAARVAKGQPPLAISRALPKPAQIAGVEFIEFATGPSQSSRLESELEGLGFQRVARHKSKDVELYRQNDVNIVVNREQDGFAHSFYLVHGASVCAMALRFDDPARALERANALGAPTYHGRIGPGEALIPAVAGVENSLIYMVKAGAHNAWDKDFNFVDAPSVSGPLNRIDHISNVVRRSEFLSWLTFYKAVLGFSDEPQVELADPYGAFYSRVISAADRSVRIPINIADGGATAASRFIDTFGGGGVQQIALSTKDVFAFVEKARGRGVRFLDIPDNYYEDLSARYDLDPALIDRMRALGILYDRHKDGEFFHIYTTMFEQRFFFEILERRNYDLFGAANTPVRLAAQANEYDRSLRDRAMLETE
jgi:4-hydroxyphenylpyruvate dioxygenase